MLEQEIRDLAKRLAERTPVPLEEWSGFLVALRREGYAVVPQTRLDSLDRYARYDPDIAYPAGGHTFPEEAIMAELDACREALAAREE